MLTCILLYSRSLFCSTQVTGNSVSLVGDGLLVGGLIAAPFTLGVSLILSVVGGGVCAVGGVTAAGAGVTEFFISRNKVAEVKKVFEADYEQAKEIQDMCEKIWGKCESVAKEYPQLKYSSAHVLAVLFVCCAKIIPDKVLPKRLTPSKETREKAIAAYKPVKVRADPYLETGSYVFDLCTGFGSGASTTITAGRTIGGAVLTALIVRSAAPGCRAVNHCSTFAGVSSKIACAAEWFQFAIGVGRGAIAVTAVLSIIDVVSLAYGSYQIHKKSHSSAGKELLKKLEELEKETATLLQMTDSLNDLLDE